MQRTRPISGRRSQLNAVLGVTRMDYREADDLVFDIVSGDGTFMFATVAKTAFPLTYRAMFGFFVK